MLIERTPPRRQATSPSRTPASQSHPLSAAKASTSKSSSSSKPVPQSYTWEPLESLGSSRRDHGERFITSVSSAGATGANAVSASLPRPSPSRPGAQYDTAANRAAKGGRDIMLMADSGHSGRNSGPRNSLTNLNSMRDTAGDETPKAVKEARNARVMERKPAENPPAQMVLDQIPTTQASQLSRSPAGSKPPPPLEAATNGTAADSNQSTPRASRPKPPASVERPLPTLAAKADTVSGNTTAGSSSSASAANDEFERKLLAAMAQAEAGVNPFLDARKAEMRGESMAAAAKQASRVMDERRKSAVEAVIEQSDAIVQDVKVAEEGHDAAAEEEEVTVTDVVTDDATASSRIAQATASHVPSSGQGTENLVLIGQNPGTRADVEDADETDAPEPVVSGRAEDARATGPESPQQRADQQTQKTDTIAIELQTVKDENARWQSLVAELKADLEAARKASSPAAGPSEVAVPSAPVNEDAAAVRAKYEALKTSYLELKVAKDEVIMQQLEAMEGTNGAQLEICALRFQLAVERGRREAAEIAAAAAAAVNPFKMASPIATETVLPDKSSALEATAKSVPKSTAAAPAGSSKSSIASIAARRPAKASSQMASDVMPPSSAAAATDDEESHLASAVEDVFDDEDELDAPMSPVRLEPVKTGKASAASSRAAASKPEPSSKRTMVAPQPRKRPVYANLDDEEDVAEPRGPSSDIDEEVDPLPTKKHKSSSHEVATKSKSGSASSTAAKRTTTMDSTAAAAPAKAVVSKTSNLAKPVAGASKTANSSTTTTTTTKKSEPAPAPAPAKAPAKQPAPTTKTTSRASAPSKAARRMTFDRAELKQVGHGSDSESDDGMQAVDDNDDDEGDETAFVLPAKKKNTKEAAAPVSGSSKTAKAGSAVATSKPAPTPAAAAAPAIKKKRRLLGPSKMPFDASSQRGDGGGDRGGLRGMAIDDGSESENLLNPALEIPLILSPVKGFGGVGGGVPAAGGQTKKGKFGLGANANRFGGGGRGMFG